MSETHLGPAALVEPIRAAAERLRPLVRETPVERSEVLAAEAGGRETAVWLKCENLQHTGSFKLRGACNKVLTLPLGELVRGVVTASTGNHGRGVAHALDLVGGRGTIYLPTTVSPGKLAALGRYASVTLELFHTDSDQTELHARRVAEEGGRVYISPYNDLDVIAGQGTVGVELARQCPRLDAVFIAVGGGGLVSGIASYLKAVRPGIRIVGCWPEHAPSLYVALQAGGIVPVAEKPTLSDGTAGGAEPGAVTFDLARELIDECVLVSEAEIADAIRLVLVEHHLVIEGAAGVAVAAWRKTAARWAGKSIAIVLCGGNIAPAKLREVLDE
ncbi:MAG TPA: serine/threonine dehydratase [Acidobacteria bacterium]|nr:serine/threonine dehydratase [Acidobacteriota bacterium]